MVGLNEITNSNSRFADEQRTGCVCVFAGATSGIGYGTLRRFVTMLQSSTFYVLGRSEERFAAKLSQLRESPNKIVFVDCQLSLIRSVDEACASITAAETKVDYLCMSPGGMPFQGATCASILSRSATPSSTN